MVYMAYKDLYQMSNTEVRPLLLPWWCWCEGPRGTAAPLGAGRPGRQAARGSWLGLMAPLLCSRCCGRAVGMASLPWASRAPTLQEEAEVWPGDHREHPPAAAAFREHRPAWPELVPVCPRQARPLPGPWAEGPCGLPGPCAGQGGLPAR